MILKNTPANRKLVNRLSDYISDTTPYFRTNVDKNWNLGKDIRFEIETAATELEEDNQISFPDSDSRACAEILLRYFESGAQEREHIRTFRLV